MQGIADLFQDYAPPNAADYRDDVQVSPKLWPQTTLGWSIAYNTELEKNPPKSWMDLCKPRIRPEEDRPGDRAVRRHHLDPHHVRAPGARRGLLEEAGGDAADPVPVGCADLRRAGARRDARSRVLLYNIAYIKKRDGAPVDIIFPPEGVPLNYYAAGVTKTAANPNAAKLFLNWCMSDEGQAFQIKELGYLTALKKPPLNPPGYDPKVIKPWAPNFEQYVKLRNELDRGVEQDLRLSAVDAACPLRAHAAERCDARRRAAQACEVEGGRA